MFRKGISFHGLVQVARIGFNLESLVRDVKLVSRMQSFSLYLHTIISKAIIFFYKVAINSWLINETDSSNNKRFCHVTLNGSQQWVDSDFEFLWVVNCTYKLMSINYKEILRKKVTKNYSKKKLQRNTPTNEVWMEAPHFWSLKIIYLKRCKI